MTDIMAELDISSMLKLKKLEIARDENSTIP